MFVHTPPARHRNLQYFDRPLVTAFQFLFLRPYRQESARAPGYYTARPADLLPPGRRTTFVHLSFLSRNIRYASGASSRSIL